MKYEILKLLYKQKAIYTFYLKKNTIVIENTLKISLEHNSATRRHELNDQLGCLASSTSLYTTQDPNCSVERDINIVAILRLKRMGCAGFNVHHRKVEKDLLIPGCLGRRRTDGIEGCHAPVP